NDSLQVSKVIDTTLTIKKMDSVLVMQDSLLRPFYVIRYDSLTGKTDYLPRFRMSVNSITKDTAYIPIPKAKNLVYAKRRLIIDTLKVLNPIKQLNIKPAKFAEDPVWWKNKNSIGLDISEAAFVNWNAGGNNSISGLLKVSLVREYKKIYTVWKNEIFARYGLNQQQDIGLRKTDDKLQINSTFGYRKDTLSNWYYSARFNFNTQFTDGFKYPDTSTPISRFFAPAYLFLGAGAYYDLKPNNFSIYLSPITLKSTFVHDKILSNSGAFGVKNGERSRMEFGSLIQTSWDKELFKNVVMTNDLSLYSDYLNKYGNIDIKWDLNFFLTINDFIKANIGAHLIYDDDIKFKDDINNDGQLETLGARVQLKQLLGIGILYVF
ncbi:MAG: DUF3078 domain-containing protein, partial [Flavobacteriaceae bacterium]|nr:DUF3078 domain-containing protein [Flavobacteriaceae bacterium]